MLVAAGGWDLRAPRAQPAPVLAALDGGAAGAATAIGGAADTGAKGRGKHDDYCLQSLIRGPQKTGGSKILRAGLYG